MADRESSLNFLTQSELKALLLKAKQAGLREYAMILLAYSIKSGGFSKLRSQFGFGKNNGLIK